MKLEETNALLTSRCKFMEGKLQQVTLQDATLPEIICRESEERRKRRKYVVLSGIPEHSSGNIAERNERDTALVGELACELGLVGFAPEQVTRIGRLTSTRPRLLRVKCRSVDAKFSLLRQSKKLRDSTRFREVFINPDLTKAQRADNASLRSELKERKKKGEKVIICNGQIVDVSSSQNFR